GVFTLSALLTPNSSGIGTHQRLGLPPCLFYTWTGLPCPSCGLTTSFTHLMHGHWREAFHVHPLGPLFFFGFALLAIFGLLEFFGKKTPLNSIFSESTLRWPYALVALFLTIWLIRLGFIIFF
ncbi:MAG TPA: hypothetical protein DF383_01810, partial [Deltaproteobacteria bacterium]|nr:hypothetical protein [Deltaproteobacteria bacterium]